MNSEIKSVSIIVIITAIIIVVGLALTKSTPKTTSVVVNGDTLVSTTTPMILGTKQPESQNVTIIEFGDFACPACAMLSPTMDKLLKEYEGSVNYGIRLIPIHGEISYKSAVAAFAAGKQGRFFEMASTLFAKQDEWTKVGADTDALFAGYATEVGVGDIAVFKSDLASETFNKVIRQMVDRDADQGRDMKIQSTPTLIIGADHKVVEGVSSYAELKKIIDDAIEAAKNAPAATSTSNGAATTPTSTPKAN